MTVQTVAPPAWAPPLAADRWVDNRTYTDPRVFAAEKERIFKRNWMLVAHESEFAQPGDYRTLALLGEPLLLARGNDGTIRAVFNTCRHRGSKVVNDACGHAAAFRCPYHFWVYDLQGGLIGVPGEEAYDGSGFVKGDYPLASLRCETLFGLVFIAFDTTLPPLRAWLGADVVAQLERPVGLAQLEVTRIDETRLTANWKVFAENARDGYHVPFVHPIFRTTSPPGPYRIFENGHAVQLLGAAPDGFEPEVWERITRDPLPGLAATDGYILTFFPDAAVHVRGNVVSLAIQRQIDATTTVLQKRVLTVVGDSAQQRADRHLAHDVWFAERLELEDEPVFLAQQEGVASSGIRFSIIARGADATTGTRGDDNRLRAWWRRWREQMGVSFNSLVEEFD